MRTAVALRHIHFEDLGILEPLLVECGFSVRYLDPTTSDVSVVDPAEPDLLIVLGGPIGAFDDDMYPFIADELRLIRERLALGRPLLGICLGAQLIARALGAAVAPMDAARGTKEIGFGALTLTEAGRSSALAALDGVPVLHWHGDRFDLPRGARLLAGTLQCDHQAFAVASHVLALQFHLEADTRFIERWLVGHCCELSHAGIDPRLLRAQAPAVADRLATAARAGMLEWLKGAGLVGDGAPDGG